jgi:MFS-type transporter involved in bile tolerance (Atg22 family)
METVTQTFGMIFVGIIIVCIVWTFGTYIVNSMDRPGKRNKKLLDNMKKLK